MARIIGVDIPENKKIKYALTYIEGIGLTRAGDIIAATKIDPNLRAKDLNEAQIREISTFIGDNFAVEGELKRKVRENIKRLTEIGSYRGLRHKVGLPVRGQKTRANARTRKGPRRGGLIVSRKKEEARPAPKPKA